MRMHLEGHGADRVFHRGDQRPGALGGQQAARVLDADRIHAERGNRPSDPAVVLVGVHGTDGVDKMAAREHSAVSRDAHRELDISYVVQGVVAGVARHSVCGAATNRQLHDVVGEEFEREQALPARPYVERRPGHTLRREPHAKPRILAQVAHADIEYRAPDQIDPVEPHLVHAVDVRKKHPVRHARRPQRLLPVAQRHVDDLHGFHRNGKTRSHAMGPVAAQSLRRRSIAARVRRRFVIPHPRPARTPEP